jgi:hypothetical protein
MDISVFSIFIWIWKLIFIFWVLKFKFQEIIWVESWNFNYKLLFSILKINISIQKIINWI